MVDFRKSGADWTTKPAHAAEAAIRAAFVLQLPAFAEVSAAEVAAAWEAVNEAANHARHNGEYQRANALVRARITLSRASRAACPQPAAAQAIDARRGEAGSFQRGVEKWMDACFIPSLYSNMTERGDRLLEEVLELLQSHGYDRSRVATLVDYVYGRPPGDPTQEVGGVMVTLAGYCWIAGIDMQAEGDRELARITQPEVMAKIRAKQEAKNALHFDSPLPGAAGDAACLTCTGIGRGYCETHREASR